MIIALMIGRAGSRGFPGKNTYKILGKPMCEYPLIAAKKSKFIKKIYTATDCKKIANISKKYKKLGKTDFHTNRCGRPCCPGIPAPGFFDS